MEQRTLPEDCFESFKLLKLTIAEKEFILFTLKFQLMYNSANIDKEQVKALIAKIEATQRTMEE